MSDAQEAALRERIAEEERAACAAKVWAYIDSCKRSMSPREIRSLQMLAAEMRGESK